MAWASTRWPGTTAPALEAGRQLFVRSCDKCHGYPDLVSISEKEWPSILERMGNKAHLSPQEREQVLHFVLAARSEQAGP